MKLVVLILVFRGQVTLDSVLTKDLHNVPSARLAAATSSGVGKEPIASGQTVRTKMIVFSLKAVLRRKNAIRMSALKKAQK